MGVSLRLFGFVFGIFSITFAQGQNCLSSDIGKLEDTEPLDKPSYTDGETVKVNCITGFSGMYKFKCLKGNWDKTLERKCTKKKCGHPGDMPNGDFRLLGGNTEFVFGATVQYTCNKGYEMASRINQRTCRNGGWDNAVPACEVLKCPPIHTEEDVIALGNTEEGGYGEVVQFDCKSPDKKIDGSNDIYCKENGEWSASVPKCIEISCKLPNIPHGTVKQRKEYKKDDTLQYDCDSRYKPRQGTPKCTKHGWTLEPECEEITCELKDTKFGIERIQPEGKTFFRVGETVQITCSKRHWIILTKATINSFKCKDDGQWDKTPICEEITCEVPSERHHVSYFYSPYFRGNLRLNERRSYRCFSGYRQMANEATCTENGLKPDPLCVEITCEVPIDRHCLSYFESSDSNLRLNERRSYRCFSDYHQMANEATCTEDGLKPDPLCAEITCEIPRDRRLHHASSDFYGNLRLNERRSYRCLADYRQMANEATCTRDGWKPDPLCADFMCEAPNIPNAQFEERTKAHYKVNSRVVYHCLTEPQQRIEITCDSQGRWSNIEPCTEKKKSCTTPTVENGFIVRNLSNEEIIHYACNLGYKPYTGNWWGAGPCTVLAHAPQKVCARPWWGEATCTNGTWKDEPRCIREDECGVWPSIQHGQLNNHTEQSALELKCDPGFNPSHTVIRCVNGTWETATCELDEQSCVIPSKVDNALIIAKPQTVYASGSHVDYKCRTNFTMSGNSRVQCHNATWEKAPTCEANCSKPLQEVNNAKLIDEIQGERKYSHGDTAHYKCDEDYESNGPTIAKCDGPTWIYPECISRICPPPPMIEDGDFNVVQKTDEVIISVLYSCQKYFVLDKSNSVKCQDGIWETPPKCLKPCKITPEIYKEYKIKRVSDDYITHSDKEDRLDCNNGWNVGGSLRYSTAQCTDGELRMGKKCTVRNQSG